MACDKALGECDKLVKGQAETIDAQQNLLKANEKRIKELEKTETNKTFWFILGSVLTGLIVILAK